MLSPYTIAANCTDITDLQGGIDDIKEAIRTYERLGKPIPHYFYSRLNKLMAKLNKLQLRERESFSVTIRFKIEEETLKKAIRHCLFYKLEPTKENIKVTIKAHVIQMGRSIIDFPEIWGDDLLVIEEEEVNKYYSSLKLDFGIFTICNK